MVVRVAGAQIPVRDVRRNEEALHRAIERAAEAGAEILLTPEGSLSGYGYPLDRTVLPTSIAMKGS